MKTALPWYAAVLVATLLNYPRAYALGDETQPELQFRADVFASFPNGKVERVSPGDGIHYQACINPQGTFVVYAGGTTGPPRIWLTDLETMETRALTPEGVFAVHPVFSWDGSAIAFAADFGQEQPRLTLNKLDTGGEPTTSYKLNIYICNLHGNDLRRITQGGWFDRRPAFSPDGNEIAFVSNRDGKRYELWRVDSDGKDVPQKILQDDIGYRPWYSKDGTTLYFFSRVDGNDRLYRVPVCGGKKKLLVNAGVGDSRGPFVDPSGNCLLTHSNRTGDWQIFEVPLDGKPPIQITPEGVAEATHATRAKNGIMAFDVIAAFKE